MPLAVGDFAFATGTLFDTGDRIGETTKVAIVDVPNGFVPGTPVTAEQLNWLFNTIGAGLTVLKNLVDVSSSWTLAQLFEVGIQVGAGLMTTAGEAWLTRIDSWAPVAAVEPRTVHWNARIVTPGFPFVAGRVRVLTLVSGSNQLLNYAITINAEPVADSKWAKDKAGAAAAILRLSPNSSSPGRFVISTKPGSEDADWTDEYGEAAPVGWSNSVLAFNGADAINAVFGSLFLDGALAVGAALSAASADIAGAMAVGGAAAITGALTTGGPVTVGTNAIIAGNLAMGTVQHERVPLAWAAIHNALASFTQPKKHGCTVARVLGATNTITVTLNDPPASADDWTPDVTVRTTPASGLVPVFVGEISKTASAYTFILHDGTATQYDLDAAGSEFELTFKAFSAIP